MSAAPLMLRSLRYGAWVAVAAALLGGGLGWLVAGGPGLGGGLLGAALSALFLGLTAISILLAGRAADGDLTNPVFLGIVLGVWVLKLLLFFVLALWLRTQDWVDPGAFGITAIGAVLGGLVGDAVAFQRTRVPLDVVLPGSAPGEPDGSAALPAVRRSSAESPDSVKGTTFPFRSTRAEAPRFRRKP